MGARLLVVVWDDEMCSCLDLSSWLTRELSSVKIVQPMSLGNS
jgi:hypothetical protein